MRRIELAKQEGLNWLSKAANQQQLGAQRMLGSCYLHGREVEKDEKKAVEWLTKSAEQGNEIAQLILGYCYEFGLGIVSDINEANKWYLMAKDNNNDWEKSIVNAVQYRFLTEYKVWIFIRVSECIIELLIILSMIGDEEMKYLSEALKINQSIQKLDFYWSNECGIDH